MRIRIAVVALIAVLGVFSHPAFARDVEGVVTDPLGHPRQYVTLGMDFNHLRFDDSSDVDGKFVLKNVPERKTFWVASAVGRRGLFIIPADAKSVAVKLVYQNACVTGRVIDAQKRGVKGATVNFYLKLGEDEIFVDDTKTDAGGYFNNWMICGNGLALTAKVMVGEGVVAASDPIALHDHQFGIDLPDLKVPDKIAGQTGEEDTRRAIGGIVQDEQGKPIVGARVDLKWSLQGTYGGRLWTQTDAAGRWSRRVPLSVTAVELKLFDDRHVSNIFDRHAVSPPVEKLIDGSAISVMPRGYLVRGVVRDEAGKPVDDALVLGASTGSNGGTLEPDEDVATHSKPDGSFEIDGIPSGEREITVYGRNLAPSVVKIDARADLPSVDVTLKTGSEIHGLVVDTSGKPIARAEITVYTWHAPDGSWHVVPRKPIADDEGRFIIAHLPPGTFDLRIWKKGYNNIFTQNTAIQAEPQTFKLFKPATFAGKVVDDASGEPVKAYTLIPGFNEEDLGPTFTDDAAVLNVKSASGAFSGQLRWGSQTTQPVRVIADGYIVKDTAVNTTDGAAPAEIRITKGEPYTGTVLRSDNDKPIADAQIAWVGPKRHAFVSEGLLSDRSYSARAEIVVHSDQQGQFKLPKTDQQGSIFVTSFYGYAQIARDDFHNGEPITVTPWATIHGSIPHGAAATATPSAAEPSRPKYVTLTPSSGPRFDENAPVSWELYAPANPDGTFTISHVPSIPLHIYMNEVGVRSHDQMITPKPGETFDVQLGAGGQTVHGRIDAPADLPTEHFNTAYGVGKHYTGVYARRADAPLPTAPGTDDIGYAATLSPDGSFTIEGVPPGRYELIAKLHAPAMPQSCGLAVAMASTKVPFEMKDQPLDLGSISLTGNPTPTAGQPMSPLEGKTLDDKSASLAALKGHVVLLDFWASWCGPCKAETPRVKELAMRYADKSKFNVLGVNLDYAPADANRYVTTEKITWPSLTFTGWGENNPVLQSLGVSSIPSFWLIDADGKLIARDIPPADLEAAVEKALR